MANDNKTRPPVVLHSVRALVKTLGGTKATASLLQVLPSAVSNWIAFGCIPPKRFFVVADALRPLGLEPSRKLFRERGPHLSHTKNREAADA